MFTNLKKEKQELIINSAINEFVRRGFEQASTNEIVKEAQISKGSLFNYFNSKKDLYYYLINYSIEVMEELHDQVDFNETDLFKRIEKIGLKKFTIQMKFPKVFEFLASAIQEESDEVKDTIKEKVEFLYHQVTKNLYKDIDYSKFREDIDVEKAIEILNWTMFGFGEKGIQQMNTFENTTSFGEHYLKEWQIYAEILKKSFYK